MTLTPRNQQSDTETKCRHKHQRGLLKLGDITLDAPFFQAPLSGYSDYPMRRIALDYGAPLTFAGLILAKTAVHPWVLRKPIFKPCDDEHPIGAQILGNDPYIMAKAAKELVNVGYDLIDLNFACPAPKVLRRCRGGHLLKEPETAIEIFRRVREAVACPVLMKLRIGFDSSEKSPDNFWKIASQASAEGIDALIVHGRTVQKRFRGTADWQILAELKRRFPDTTIIGSGDLFDASTVAQRLKTTGLDGAVIARGAIGNPWIFRNLRAALEGEPKPAPPGLAEQGRVIIRHFEMTLSLHGMARAVRYLRKFIIHYCRLHPQRKKAQRSLLSAHDKYQLLTAIKQWYSLG